MRRTVPTRTTAICLSTLRGQATPPHLAHGRYLAWRGDDDDSSVFVLTPHHYQRNAVLAKLEAAQNAGRLTESAASQVNTIGKTVNTVEKMQGQERDLVRH